MDKESNSTKYFMGINNAHDAAASIVSDNGIEVAIREDRLVRKKYYDGFPEHSIQYCLDALNLHSINEVQAITINQYPRLDGKKMLRDMGFSGQVLINPSHHLLHAYYARFFTNYADLLIAIADGSGYNYGEYIRKRSPYIGEMLPPDDAEESETTFLVESGELRLLTKKWGLWRANYPYFRFPSLGHAYGVACQHIFGDVSGWLRAGKIMGLASFGNAETNLPNLMSFENDEVDVNLDWADHLPKLTEMEEYWLDENRQNIAAKAQHDLEHCMIDWLDSLQKQTGIQKLCLTGGVIHNSVANGKIVNEKSFKSYYFTPAADDSGVAIGGALYAFHHIFGQPPKGRFKNDFLGKTYSPECIRSAVRNDSRLVVRKHSDYEGFIKASASKLSDGHIIAIHDGRSEFSARALGHRSIFCDPTLPNAKDFLNSRVKYRESFRPYAAIVLQDRATEYFNIQPDSPFMMVVAEIKKNKRSQIPAVCHVDGTCRIQTISDEYDGFALKIIREFDKISGIPMVLNTSFNVRGEPIVETPEQAVECLCSTGIDTLFMYPYEISKIPLSWCLDDLEFLMLYPSLGKNVMLTKTQQYVDGKVHQSYLVNYGFAKFTQVTSTDFQMLSNIDGMRSIKEIADILTEGSLLQSMRKYVELGILNIRSKAH